MSSAPGGCGSLWGRASVVTWWAGTGDSAEGLTLGRAAPATRGAPFQTSTASGSRREPALGPRPGSGRPALAPPSPTLTSPGPGHRHSPAPSVPGPGDAHGKSNTLRWVSSDGSVAGSCRLSAPLLLGRLGTWAPWSSWGWGPAALAPAASRAGPGGRGAAAGGCRARRLPGKSAPQLAPGPEGCVPFPPNPRLLGASFTGPRATLRGSGVKEANRDKCRVCYPPGGSRQGSLSEPPDLGRRGPACSMFRGGPGRGAPLGGFREVVSHGVTSW